MSGTVAAQHDERMRLCRSWARSLSPVKAVFLLSIAALSGNLLFASCAAQAPAVTTAWNGKQFSVDVGHLIARSNIELERPNRLTREAMPLGNGQLGLAVWAPEGLRIQLNRGDTLPHRLSPGQVDLPGLADMMRAPDFHGQLDLVHGELVETGGGITATVYVQPDTDMAVVDVTGVPSDRPQTIKLCLWPPREPQTQIVRRFGMMSETWKDAGEPGASGKRFGALAGLAADGRSVSFLREDARTLRMSVLPKADGSFRVFIPSPSFNGSDSASLALARSLEHRSPIAHKLWWSHFWLHAGMLKITSPDSSGEYMENLRVISLFTAAAERGRDLPNSQAGVADLFSAVRDEHRWDPAAYWHLNLSMQVAADIGAGLSWLNSAYFSLYRNNLPNIEAWTKEHMDGRNGACVPETMRFNGVGIEYESGSGKSTTALDCDARFQPFFNARTLSTGAEISAWIWRQYLVTRDLRFLQENYPVMLAATRFLLAYEEAGPDGYNHTSPSNAHETQWDVMDPTTDIAARMFLYTTTAQAAHLLGRDQDLVAQLHEAIRHIPSFPRTQQHAPLSLLTASSDVEGKDVIADSYLPDARNHNTENIGLYPVWPFDLIGVESPLLDLAKRTFHDRPYPIYARAADWSFDPIQAARLGLGPEVKSTLLQLTQDYQKFPNGLADWGGTSQEFYIEQAAVATDALQEALVQEDDGVIEIARALPPGWDFTGNVYVLGDNRVDVQTSGGVVSTLVIEAGGSQSLRLRSPWLGGVVSVRDETTGKMMVTNTEESEVSWHTEAKHAYRVYRPQSPVLSYAPVETDPAHGVRHLGGVQIGVSSDSAMSVHE